MGYELFISSIQTIQINSIKTTPRDCVGLLVYAV